MTAILGFAYAGTPLLMGDIAESTRGLSSSPPVYVPSVGRISLPSHPVSRLRVSGLVQKIAILDPTLAFAWCGDVAIAKDVLLRVRDAHRICPFTYSSLTALLDEDSPSIRSGAVGLIGLMKDSAGWRMFGRNVHRESDPNFVAIFADGTGADTVAAQLRLMGTTSQGYGSPLHGAVSAAATLSGALITHEMHHRESLNALYGGAYELATILDGFSAKVRDIAYVHWRADLDGTKVFLHRTPRVFRHSYWNDLLVVRTVRFLSSEDAQPEEDDSYTLVRPVFRELTEDDGLRAPVPPLAAPILVHLFTFRALDGEVYTASMVHFAHSAGFEITELTLPDNKHKIELRISEQFIRDAGAAIFAGFRAA